MPLVAVLVALMTAPVPGSAHEMHRADGDDSRSPLDLAEVSVEHTANALVYRFKTYRRWRPAMMTPTSYFAVAIDIDEDGLLERCAFLYAIEGDLRGQLTNCGRRAFDALTVRKISPREASITVPRGKVGGSHYWGAVSRWDADIPCNPNACVDFLPNRSLLFHDLVAPTVTWVTTLGPPNLSTQLSSTPTVPVQITATDEDTKVVTYGFQRFVDDEWVDFDSAPGSGSITHALDLQEGETYKLRPYAIDAHGNEGIQGSSITMTVPVDDTSPDVTYVGEWVTESDQDGWYRGTYHSSGTEGDYLKFTFTLGSRGGAFNVLVGPGNGTGTLVLDGTPASSFIETPTTPHGRTGGGGFWTTGGKHTIRVKVTDGTINIDGLIVTQN